MRGYLRAHRSSNWGSSKRWVCHTPVSFALALGFRERRVPDRPRPDWPTPLDLRCRPLKESAPSPVPIAISERAV